MRKIVLKVFSVVFLGITIFSCEKDREQSLNSGEVSYLPIEDCDIHPLGDTLYLSYTSGVDWMMRVRSSNTGSSTWVTARPNRSAQSSGYYAAGTTEIMLVVSPYYDKDGDRTNLSERLCAISFLDSEGHVLDNFNITQQKAVIEISQDELTLPWKQGGTSFTVTSNVQWKAEVIGGEDEFTITENGNKIMGKLTQGFRFSDAEDVTVRFVSNSHNMSSDHTSKGADIKIVPIKTKDGAGQTMTLPEELSKAVGDTVSVKQNYLIFDVVDEAGNAIDELSGFNELGYDFVSSNENYLQLVNDCIKTYYVKLESGYAFMDNSAEISGIKKDSMPAPSDNEDGREISFVKNFVTWRDPSNTNDNEISRELKVWIVDESGQKIEGTEKTLVLNQDPYVFSLEEGGVPVEEYSKVIKNLGDTLVFSIQTTGPWELRKDGVKVDKTPEWIRFVEEKGSGNSMYKLNGDGSALINLQVQDQNLYFSDDNRNVFQGYEFCSCLNNLSVPVSAIQEPFVFDVQYMQDDNSDLMTVSRFGTGDNPVSVSITSSGPWKLTLADVQKNGEWLHPEVLSGNACQNYVVTLSADRYDEMSTTDFREKELKFVSVLHQDSDIDYDNSDAKNLRFKQESLRVAIKKSSSSTEDWTPENWPAYIGDENGNPTLNHQSFYAQISADWTFQTDCDWIKLYDQSGMETTTGGNYATYRVGVSTNSSDQQREGEFKIIVDLGENEMCFNYDVVQEAFEFDVLYNGNELTEEMVFGFQDVSVIDNNPFSFNIKTTNNAPWTIRVNDASGMFSIDDNIRRCGTTTWSVVPEDNVLTQDREAELIFTSGVSGQSRKVTFRQDRFIWDVGYYSWSNFDEVEQETRSLTLLSSKKPVIKGSAIEWLGKCEVKSGSVENQYIVEIVQQPNYSTSPRTGNVVIVGYEGEHEEIISLTQREYCFETDINKVLESEYGPLDEIDETVTVQCSGDVRASLNGQSLSVSSTIVSGNLRDVEREVDIEMGPNYSKNPRNCQVEIVSKDTDKLKSTFAFSQRGYVFNTSDLPANMEIPADSFRKDYQVLCSGVLKATGANVTLSGNDVATGANKYTVTVEIAENTATTVKEHTIKVYSEDSTLADASWQAYTFTLTQAAAAN